MSSPSPALLWFRRDDMRLEDHLPLAAASRDGRPLICVYIRDTSPPLPPLSGAALWWEQQSLRHMQAELAELGGRLLILRGDPVKLLPELARRNSATALYYGRRYHKSEQEQEAHITEALSLMGVKAHSFWNSSLLPPDLLLTKTGTPFKVFTAFWKALQRHPVPTPLPRPATLHFHPLNAPASADLASCSPALPEESLYPLPDNDPHWAQDIRGAWQASLDEPVTQLEDFITHNLSHYETERDRPDHEGTSRLSPLLATGILSPRSIWQKITAGRASTEAKDCFLSEIAWRDFGRYSLFHQPDLPYRALNEKFLSFPWQKDPQALTAWQKGQTGIPIIDAGMRELWRTGWMHNRVRMIVGSFLTKHLLTDWREGEAWFRDTLIDADNASNAMNWQWVAGTGIDASPFFRIFNPLRQAEKFDPSGDYIRRWVPELAALPTPHVFAPWEAPPLLLHQAGIALGSTYPAPVMDLAIGRKRALDALASLKSTTF